jgi:arginyl-tRNA synthetase
LPADTNTAVTQSTKAGFGDYQINGAMAAAKLLETNPRDLAQQLLEKLDLADIAEKVEVAGPGFINVTLKNDWLATQLQPALLDSRLGVSKNQKPQKVVEIILRQTLPRKCTWAIYAPPSLVMQWCVRWNSGVMK